MTKHSKSNLSGLTFGFMRRRRWALLGAIALCASAIVAVASPAQAYACGGSTRYRGIDADKYARNAVEVQGIIKIPHQADVTGISTSHGASAADVYLINGPDFVQAGWYVGKNDTGLSYTTSPKVFWGEYRLGAHGNSNENTHTLGSLGWGSTHTFRISFNSEAGAYEIYVDGVYKAVTQYHHFAAYNYLASPQFNGEINFMCIRMEALADNSPNKSLKYAIYGSNGVAWSWFTDSRTSFKPANSTFTLVTTSGGTPASAYAYGGGS